VTTGRSSSIISVQKIAKLKESLASSQDDEEVKEPVGEYNEFLTLNTPG
jgi:hypothetical protein